MTWGGKGEQSPTSKLTAADVALIKRALKRGERQRDIARRFGVGQSTINRIATGLSWRHVKIEDEGEK